MQSRDDVRRSSGHKRIFDFFEFVSAVFIDGYEIVQDRCLAVELHERQSIVKLSFSPFVEAEASISNTKSIPMRVSESWVSA